MAHPDRPSTFSRRDFLRLSALFGLAAVSTACAPQAPDKPQQNAFKAVYGSDGKTIVGWVDANNVFHPIQTPTPGAGEPTRTPTATPTETEIAKTIYQLSQERRAQWERFWPQTPEQAAEMFGGDSNKWQRNPDWPDDKKIQAPFLGVQDYTNIEWRYTGKPDDLEWPQTAEEATLKFFGVDPKTGRPRIPTKFIEIAWKNPRTGMVEGWHLTEDHWKETGKPADVAISIYAGVVVEGYSAAQTNDPKDDRNFVIWGGPVSKQITSISIPLLQGCTIWMPGTDPNAIALRMQLYPAGNDRPHYTGPNGEQLGPDAYGFTPVYPAANFVEKE